MHFADAVERLRLARLLITKYAADCQAVGIDLAPFCFPIQQLDAALAELEPLQPLQPLLAADRDKGAAAR